MQINKKNKKQSNSTGFTLLEFVVVMAIGVVLATGSFLTYSNYKTRKDLEFALDEVFSLVKSAQKKSVIQENGSGWGVRFNSSTTGADSYELFAGTEYSTSSVNFAKSFRRSINFTEPADGRSYDMIFEPRTGKLDEKKVITLSHTKDNKKAGDVIVSKLGKSVREMEDNIVGYWHFDEGTGTSTADASGEGNAGELMNGPTWVSGSDCVAGGCLDFDGSDDYVEFGDLAGSIISNPEGESMSWGAWVKVEGSGYRYIISSGGQSSSRGISMDISNNNELRCGFSDGDNDVFMSTELLDLSSFVHLFCVFDQESNKLFAYMNGSLNASSTATLNSETDVYSDLIIGAPNNNKLSYLFNGKLDEVRIYNTALSSSTIKSIYDNLK